MHFSNKEHDVGSVGSDIMASGGANVTYIRSYLAPPNQTDLRASGLIPAFMFAKAVSRR